jgi:serine/threonine protein kinase
MSPEQLRGEKLTPASDVYAMAVIAHEMVTGKRPENLDVAPVRRGLTAKAKDVIRRGLLSRPADRYQSAKQFGDDLHSALVKPQASFSWLKAIAAVLVVSLLLFGIYEYRDKLFKDRRTGQTVLPSRKGFDYWLMVQQTRDGKPYKEPTKANGAAPLDTEDQFQLNVLSQESGYLYIFHERPPEADNVSFKMIYPKKGTNDASATIGANQTFHSDWITLKPPAGSENFWIVWSVSPVNELESAKNLALTHPQAGLTDQNLISVKEFLKTMQTKIDVSVRRYEATQSAPVRANNDLVLALVEFKHLYPLRIPASISHQKIFDSRDGICLISTPCEL